MAKSDVLGLYEVTVFGSGRRWIAHGYTRHRWTLADKAKRRIAKAHGVAVDRLVAHATLVMAGTAAEVGWGGGDEITIQELGLPGGAEAGRDSGSRDPREIFAGVPL